MVNPENLNLVRPITDLSYGHLDVYKSGPKYIRKLDSID